MYRVSSPPNDADTPDNPNAVSRMAQRGSTALQLALANDKEEAAAVLRAHGAQVSLFFAAEKGMTDEVVARIAAGQDVNARDQVIFLCVCVCVCGCVCVCVCVRVRIYTYTHTHTHTHTRITHTHTHT
jgi:hypothetical protein